MKETKLTIGILLALHLIGIAKQTNGCDFPPKSLVQKPRSEYRGVYLNEAYEYSVVIPKDLTGYDEPDPANHHGFGLVVGELPQSYLFVSAEANSLEANAPVDEAIRNLEYLREDRKLIESVKVTQSHLGQLKAVRVVVTYTCPTSTKRYVQASTFALSPHNDHVYEITLYSLASQHKNVISILDQLLMSWEYKPH